MNTRGTSGDAVEAADRAGSIVTEHVRSIIDAAQARAADIQREAEREAGEMREQAMESANAVLERIGSVESSLGTLVADLRRETDSLSSGSNQPRQ